MNVSELIKRLKKMPQELDVCFKDQGTDSEAYDVVERVVLKEGWEGNDDFVALS